MMAKDPLQDSDLFRMELSKDRLQDAELAQRLKTQVQTYKAERKRFELRQGKMVLEELKKSWRMRSTN
jgi:hypothetical protein